MRTTLLAIVLVATLGLLPGAAVAQQKTSEADVKIVAGPIPQHITDTHAMLWWETNRPSSTIVTYGTSQSGQNQHADLPWGKKAHQVRLTNLQPGATYFYTVKTSVGRSLDSGSFQALSTEQAKGPFQITHGPDIEKLAPDSAVVAWTTNQPASSIVMYGTDPNNLTQQAQTGWGETTHRVIVRHLQPNQQYWFQVKSGQAKGTGRGAESAKFSATTPNRGQQAMVFNTR